MKQKGPSHRCRCKILNLTYDFLHAKIVREPPTNCQKHDRLLLRTEKNHDVHSAISGRWHKIIASTTIAYHDFLTASTEHWLVTSTSCQCGCIESWKLPEQMSIWIWWETGLEMNQTVIFNLYTSRWIPGSSERFQVLGLLQVCWWRLH